MTILVIAEHDNIKLNNATRNVITAACQLAQDIHVLVVGDNCASVVTSAQQLFNIKLVLVADHPAYAHALAENFAELIKTLAPDYTYIMAPATTFGKNILPRAAALLNVEQISDVSQILSANTFVRPIYAGNALATVQNLCAKQLLTIRTTAFAACELTTTSCEIKTLPNICDFKLSEFVSLEKNITGKLPELTTARIVVAGGRGFQNQENFKLLEQLAIVLNAAIGASRAAVDAGFAPNDCQVGQTGKIVAPELYLAIGISGAIQHVAGMKDSKVIVAINIDPEAAIFKIADYGIVGDLFTIVPELIQALTRV